MNRWEHCPPRKRLEDLLAEAEQLAAADYQAFISHTEVCPACRDTLERIICDDELERFQRLLGNGSGPTSGPGAGPEVTWGSERDDVPTAFAFPKSARAGGLGQLGPYHIVRELGRGGMGAVFLGSDEHLGRPVAIKVLKPELAALDSYRARFEREGRKAGTIKHQHVVAIHHAGSTPEFALPYLVMEFVEGETLRDRLARQMVLPPREAAEIARQVARGLAAAHAQGVVHRDIKPSNILLEEDSGLAKIADFGLARDVDESEQISTASAVVGTASYMSPEQIQPSHRVDERSDVFSLGVVLYEMLTGERPFRGTTISVVMQQVVHEEPTPPRGLNSAVSRDLETITLKCLAKEPARRYQKAAELAEDLERWLRSEPIHARPLGHAGKFWRFCRRQPGLAAASGLAAAALVAVTALSLLFAYHKVKATEEARNGTRVLVGLLDAVEPAGIGIFPFGNTVGQARHRSMREFLDWDAQKMVIDSLKDQPDVQAMLMDSLGNLYRSLARYPEARRMLQSSLETRRKSLGNKHPDVAMSLYYLAWLYGDQGYHEEALSLFEEALALRGVNDEDRFVISVKFNLAWFLIDTEEYAWSERLFREVLDNCRQRRETEPRDVAFASLGLAHVLLEQKRYGSELTSLAAEATAILQKQQREGSFLGSVVGPGLMAVVQRELLRDYQGAVKSFNECVQISRLSVGQHPYLSIVLTELGRTFEKVGKDDEAGRCYRECLDIAGRTQEYGHPRVVTQTRGLAELLTRNKRYAEGAKLFEDLVERRRREFGEDHPLVAEPLLEFGKFVSVYGNDDKKAGKHEQSLREALRIFKKNPPRLSLYYGRCLQYLGTVLMWKEEYAEAEALLREAWATKKRADKTRHREIPRLLHDLARVLICQGKCTEGEMLLRQADSPKIGHEENRSAGDLFCQAAIYSQAATIVVNDANLVRAEQDKLAEQYARAAIRMLNKAHTKGLFKDVDRFERLKTDNKFDPLRKREDFQKLFQEIASGQGH